MGLHSSGPRKLAESVKPEWPAARTPPAVAEEFIGALTQRDLERLEACFQPEARLRALIPSGPEERLGSATIAAQFIDWFRQASDLQIIEQMTDTISDRLHIRYRFRETYSDGDTDVIQQDAFCDIKGGRILGMDLVCSGHRPERQGPEIEVRQYDAGELGCGSGLPQAFRQEIGTVPVGAVLEIRTRDPSAKEDLPSLARLLGHRVLRVESSLDGATILAVQRGR